MASRKNNVTAKEVARYAGVSQATVSMILNNYENVRFTDETRQKVLAACNELGYKGINNHSNDGKIILVVLPSCDNLHYAKQISAMQSRASEYGYTCLTLSTYRNPKLENNLLQCISSMPIAGTIFLYQLEKISIMERAGTLKPCVVVCDRNLDVKLDTIEVNSYEIGAIIAEHMIKLGHTSVAYISTYLNNSFISRVQRLEGIRNTYKLHGYGKDAVKLVTLQTENISPRGNTDDYTAGVLLTNKALDRYGDEISAIIGYNDMICFGILDACKKRGFQIPRDYSVIGCDNIHISESSSMSLTTVEHYPHLRSKDAVDLLLRKIRENQNNTTDVDATGITRVEYEPKIIIRSSTKSIKK